MTNPAIYEEAKIVASGAASGRPGTYTVALFLADHPEFTDANNAALLPETIIGSYVDMANDTVSPDLWGSYYTLAAGLFVAHMCALRLQTYATHSTAAETAGNSAQEGVVKSATMGDTSVSYDNTAVTEGTKKWGAWNLTKYGSEFVTYAKLLGLSGAFYV